MSSESTLKRHRQELQQKHPIYSLFDTLDPLALPADSRLLLHHEAGLIADAVISQELTASPAALKTAGALAHLSPDDAVSTFGAWRKAVESGYPKRKGMQLLLDEFATWLERLSAQARGPFLEALPRVGPCAHELESEGMQKLVAAANAQASSEECHALLTFVGRYGETTGDIVLGACEIGHRALAWGRPELLSRLGAVLTVEKILDSAEAEKLLPAAGHASTITAALGEAHWRAALELVVTVAETNLSSAYVTARDLPKALKRVPPAAAQHYLEDFARLARLVGVRVVGYGVKELPALYGRLGPERAHAFASAAGDAAESYGSMAGYYFLERKTAAARELTG